MQTSTHPRGSGRISGRRRGRVRTALAPLLLAAVLGCGGGGGQDLSECLNGVVNSGEQCDDGNLVENDDCTTACQRARCGDGVIHTGVEQCDAPDLAGTTCASLGRGGAAPGCNGACEFDLSPCGDLFTPSATATATATGTATSTPTPTSTPLPTGVATFTATTTPTPTPSPTPTQDPCGDGVIGLDGLPPDPYPNADQICANCPADCQVGTCAPGSMDVTYQVDFAPPPGQNPTAFTILIGYRGDVLTLPAAELRARVRPVTPPLPQAFSVNDLGYAARVVMTRTSRISGPSVTARFAVCDGGAVPSPADVSCIVEGCAGGGGSIPGCRCTIAFQPVASGGIR